MGRTEVTVGQFQMFVASTGFVTDAEKPGGKTQCFNPEWVQKLVGRKNRKSPPDPFCSGHGQASGSVPLSLANG